MRPRPLVSVLISLTAGAILLSGCGVPPELQERPGTSVPRPTSTGNTPGSGPPVNPVTRPSATTGFTDRIAVDCGGEPTGEDVIEVLRDEGVLDGGARATVSFGPVCSGGWQLTVVTVPELDPLQVLTRDDDPLELVTAGTDVCTVEVRVQAPPGIQTAAGCVG